MDDIADGMQARRGTVLLLLLPPLLAAAVAATGPAGDGERESKLGRVRDGRLLACRAREMEASEERRKRERESARDLQLPGYGDP